jgi:hypothetical protein
MRERIVSDDTSDAIISANSYHGNFGSSDEAELENPVKRSEIDDGFGRRLIHGTDGRIAW